MFSTLPGYDTAPPFEPTYTALASYDVDGMGSGPSSYFDACLGLSDGFDTGLGIDTGLSDSFDSGMDSFDSGFGDNGFSGGDSGGGGFSSGGE